MAPEVILRQHVTEKSTILADSRNAYVCTVSPSATKDVIRKAVESRFGVRVLGVRVINRNGKPRRFKGREIQLPAKRIAVVTLHKDDRVPSEQ